MPDLLETIHREDTIAAHTQSVERVIAYMKANLAEPINLNQMALLGAISKFHLVRVFEEITGTTPHHFLACLRIQKAKELLLHSDASITDICMEIGYSSLGSFSQTFSDLVGISPKDFRALPRRFDALRFANAVRRYTVAQRKTSGPYLEGVVSAPPYSRGFIFVGVFTGGVPQGIPDSGTVLLRPGSFRIPRPAIQEFYLLAALVPLSASMAGIATSLSVGLIASRHLTGMTTDQSIPPFLQLRSMRSTDPPIVVAPPALLGSRW